MNSERLLTIAIPTYCRAKYLEKAINSISSQYDERVEVLVSDNASTDSTEEVVIEAQKTIPITYIKNESNIGSDANFLQCFRKAKGKYVLLLGDDDRIVEGKLKIILNFLATGSDFDLIFLNHGFFYEDETTDAIHIYDYFELDTGNKNNASKMELLDYAKAQLTYMSCLVFSKSDIDKLDCPEHFIGTYFIHSCIAASITESPDSKIGIITCPCVIQRLSLMGESGAVLKNAFRIFGNGMHFLFYDVLPKCGYNSQKAQHIYKKTIYRIFLSHILRLKARDVRDWKPEFWKYGYANIKSFPDAWLWVMPALIVPKFLARMVVFKVIPKYKTQKAKKQVLKECEKE